MNDAADDANFSPEHLRQLQSQPPTACTAPAQILHPVPNRHFPFLPPKSAAGPVFDLHLSNGRSAAGAGGKDKEKETILTSELPDGMGLAGDLQVAPNVYHALKNGNAVVALESTIISHGMPFPQNLETAKDLEAIVKQNGATPATIAILDGVPCIGLNDEQLERLAKLGSNAQKTARRDISPVVAARGNGATTVSATMFLASKVGIPIFVTGGIGGVHRHAEQTMDISSDLTELGRTPVTVISAGVKSILDIPKTLEYLETQGVTVAAYGTNEFPAFFTQSSGCQVPCRLDSPEECARLINANMNLRLGSGMLIAVPIPKEHAASGYIIESAIQRALEEAKNKNVTGNAATPFLLSRVNYLTRGASLAANIALVKNNAYIGSKIAVALANMRRRVNNNSVRSAL